MLGIRIRQCGSRRHGRGTGDAWENASTTFDAASDIRNCHKNLLATDSLALRSDCENGTYDD